MGKDKLLLPFGHSSLLAHVTTLMKSLFHEVIVVTREPDKHRDLPAKVVADSPTSQHRCALVGIHTGLEAASTPRAFVVGGDMPFVNRRFVRHLVDQSSAAWLTIPRYGGFLEPLCAVYDVRCAVPILRQLDQGEYKVDQLLAKVSVREISESIIKMYDPDLLSFFNVNTAEEYAAALKLLEGMDTDMLSSQQRIH